MLPRVTAGSETPYKLIRREQKEHDVMLESLLERGSESRRSKMFKKR